MISVFLLYVLTLMNLCDQGNATALYRACESSSSETALLLLQAKADTVPYPLNVRILCSNMLPASSCCIAKYAELPDCADGCLL
jgi:hypothetical protein